MDQSAVVVDSKPSLAPTLSSALALPIPRFSRWFLGAFLVVFAVAVNAADRVQPASKPFRIGWLSVSSDAGRGVDDFKQGLRDLRYVEGRDFIVDNRHAAGSLSALADVAAELARGAVDIIVTSGELPALAAKRTTKTIPIVAIELAWDPVKAGLVSSLGRPDGN